MPELPEVEITRRGIAPHIEGARIQQMIVREPRLRWPVPRTLPRRLAGQTIERVSRRAKYLLLHLSNGTLLLHLGMSGNLRIVPAATAVRKHDHVDWVLANGLALRLHDPRRFGAVLWTERDPHDHARLRDLGPEPLDPQGFTAEYLYARSRARRPAIKTWLMDSRVVVGVGNIYANEALFLAGIHPRTAAGRVSLARYQRLVPAVRQVLEESIAAGGTTLRDYLKSDGQPGYFKLALRVYGRAGLDCPGCGEPVRQIRLNQRSTFYCPRCQH